MIEEQPQPSTKLECTCKYKTADGICCICKNHHTNCVCQKNEQSFKLKEELVDILKATMDNIENLPIHARFSPVTHADLAAVIHTLYKIFKS